MQKRAAEEAARKETLQVVERWLHAAPPAARWSKRMPVEFLHGRPLSPEELEMLREQIEEGFDNIAEVDPESRGIVARNWPYLLEKLPPEGD
jgi:hypothetical protein